MKDYRSALTAFAVTVGIIGVAHAVTDTTFHYSTPKTGWLALSQVIWLSAKRQEACG